MINWLQILVDGSMISWTRIWPGGYDLNFSTVVLAATKKQGRSWEEPIACRSIKNSGKVNYNFHICHGLTYELEFCLALQGICLTCAEEFIPAQTISTLFRLLTFAKPGVRLLWMCTRHNTWFLVQSITYSGHILGAMVQTSSLGKDKDHTKTVGFDFMS